MNSGGILLAYLCVKVCTASVLVLSCNNACSTDNADFYHKQDFTCNVVDGPVEFNESLRAAANPTIETASWYIFKKGGIQKLAINLTWSISGHIAAALFQHGYELSLNIDSAELTKTFTISLSAVSRTSLQSYKQVIMNYDCLGVNTIDLSPGKQYVAIMRGIPYHQESQLDMAIIRIPDCDSLEFGISKTINCQIDQGPLHPPTTVAANISTTTIRVYTDRQYTLVKISLTVAAPLLVLILILGLLCHCKNKTRYQPKTVLVVTNAFTSNSDVVNWSEQLITDLKSVSCKVIFSLWHLTSISSLGCSVWFHNQLKIADCAIFIFCQQENVEHQCIPMETDPLFDTFDVGLRVIQKKVLEDVGPLVLAVHFDKKSAVLIPDIFCESNTFSFPKQRDRMLRKILAHHQTQH